MITLRIESDKQRLLDMIQACTHSFVEFNSCTVYCMTDIAYKEAKELIADVNISYIVLEESEN